MWVARDYDGSLYIGKDKPIRGTRKMWLWKDQPSQSILMEGFPFEDLPNFIKELEWKDAPIQVKFKIEKK